MSRSALRAEALDASARWLAAGCNLEDPLLAEQRALVDPLLRRAAPTAYGPDRDRGTLGLTLLHLDGLSPA